MGLFDRFKRRESAGIDVMRQNIVAGAMDSDSDYVHTYDNRNITFTGDLADYDYDAILRDKQSNINSLFELSDYYVDKDPIYRGIIKGVYTAFSVSDWKLIGANEKTKEKYEDYYRRINLRDRMSSIFYQYYKYGNVYIYLMDDGSIITLPVHKCRISNMMLNGEPIIEYNAQSISTDIMNQGSKAEKPYVDDEDIKERLRGYPPEVANAVNDGSQWIQLNPENTFVLQDLKEDWMRYSIPIIAACLTALSKKALIDNYEISLLNLGINSFYHVKYGSDKIVNDYMPNSSELNAVHRIFDKAMRSKNRAALAVTNNFADAKVVQADTRQLFEYDKYKDVNAEILSAGGISGIIVSGRAEDGSTFASAQVSINTANKRIEIARENFCELMNKINRRVNGTAMTRSASDKVPQFTLVPIDLSGNSKFQKTCMDLWKEGCMSTETLLQTHGFDFKQEYTRKEKEISDGSFAVLSKEAGTVQDNSDQTEDKQKGRPTLTDDERESDPAKSVTGRAPKPSRPEGSQANDDNG